MRIDKDSMERRISEMWAALGDIPHGDPDRDQALQQGRDAERKLRDQLAMQERLDEAAPDMLAALCGSDFEDTEGHLCSLTWTESVLREAMDLADSHGDPGAFREGIQEALTMCSELRKLRDRVLAMEVASVPQ